MSTFQIRAAEMNDAQDMAVVRVETWRATYRGMIPDAFLQALSAEALAENWRKAFWEDGDRGLGIFVAEDEQNHIVGIAICGPSQEPDPAYEGEIYVLYVLPAYQNQGIGRALVAACARHLTQVMGLKSMLVWVIAENPYRRFYESLGGIFVREKHQEIGGKIITEAGYGWIDIHVLLQES
ncbi:MAG TPA: GNAT family N-acetyltransferase [Anaerolineales bacterium]|nr:GNAT family N-acetyltransferase [Anaerolineales bacterium]